MADRHTLQRPAELIQFNEEKQTFLYFTVLLIRVAAVVGGCIGLVAMAGWLGEWPSLERILPGTVEMHVSAALGLMMAGFALWLLAVPCSPASRRCGEVLAVIVAALGLSTLSQYLFGWQLGIDALLLNDTAGVYNAIRGRMAPFAAAALAAMGVALLVLPRPRMRTMASVCALASLLIGASSVVGYVWNVRELTTDAVLPPGPLNTGLALVFLSAGTLLAIRRRAALSTWSPAITSIEGKVLSGFAMSFVLLAFGSGISYKVTTVFTKSTKAVSESQEVRAWLGKLHGDISEAGLTQSNYRFSGRPEQLDHYRSLMATVADEVKYIRLLVSDSPRQRETVVLLQSKTDRARVLLDRGASLSDTTGFVGTTKQVEWEQAMDAVRAVLLVIETMKITEEKLLVERQADLEWFTRFTVISMLLTMVVAAGLLAALYLQIRLKFHARRVAEQSLVAARDAAEISRQVADTANRAKSTFLATMSHEIRTPMNGLLGTLELLSLSQLDSAQHTMLNVIRESGRSLIRILDDILDFSKMEAMKLEIQPEVVSIRNLIEDFHALYAGNASSKGLTISCRVDAALSPAVMVDPTRLRQILNNLVSNALKFTSHGQIDITADVVEHTGAAQRIRFSVKDTGIGISEEQQLRLFQPFAQAGSSFYGGSGLGLAICRRLAHLMGGTVQMVSAPDKGTTMTLELCLPVAGPDLLAARESASSAPSLFAIAGARREPPGVAQAAAEGTLVLLADDHPTNRTLLLRQVNLLGYAAECARDGVEALALWESGRFRLLLTDCSMPGMDGYELTRVIRAREAATGARRLPIVACTANALAGEIEVCLSTGMDDYLAKPIELKTLLPKLERWLPLPRAPVPAVARKPATPPAAQRIPIDHRTLAQVSSGDPNVERAIFAEFQLANDGDTALLKQAVLAGDTAEVKRLAHLIKGASNMVGALALTNLCERIEQANQSGDWLEVKSCLNALDHEISELNRYFCTLSQTTEQA